MEVKTRLQTDRGRRHPGGVGGAQLSSLISSGPKNGYSGRSGKDARGTPTLSLTATTSGRMVLDEETVKHLEETLEEQSDILLKKGDVLVQRSNTLELVGTTAIFEAALWRVSIQTS